MKFDFFNANFTPIEKYNLLSVYPEFLVKKSKDLMIRGGKFYAVIDKKTGFWQTDERVIQEFIDEELEDFARKKQAEQEASRLALTLWKQ